jgi:hypothetical protein
MCTHNDVGHHPDVPVGDGPAKVSGSRDEHDA